MPGRAHRRNLYGQRSGRSLSQGQRERLDRHLARLRLNMTTDSEGNDHLALHRDFPVDTPIWLEIGFGSGEHLVHHARANPDHGFIGCEVYKRGVAIAIGRIIDAGLANVRIFPGDIRDLLDILPDDSISRTFLMYPDPWPKIRHHRRRFVNPEYLDPLASVMKPGSELRIATDIPDFARQALVQIQIQGSFTWTATSRKDWNHRWPDAISTRYEAKAIGHGRTCQYLTFTRT